MLIVALASSASTPNLKRGLLLNQAPTVCHKRSFNAALEVNSSEIAQPNHPAPDAKSDPLTQPDADSPANIKIRVKIYASE